MDNALRYEPAILNADFSSTIPESLAMSGEGSLRTYYAPFDHVNRQAKVVLVGITPGKFQALAALRSLQLDLRSGAALEVALCKAKETASFSGTMRASLVALLDCIGLDTALKLPSCSQLFGGRADLIHYTSALRYPVFKDGANYAGDPSILRTPYLLRMVELWLADEAQALGHATWVPLGKKPTAVLQHLVRIGVLADTQVLAGLPHPSGENAERTSYFLGRKERHLLSMKTKASDLDAARDLLIQKVAALA